MNYQELKHFLTQKEGMKMQHIYQPMMIKTLLRSKDFTTTVRTIAKTFLTEDEELIDYYAAITRNMPGNVLRRHNVVRFEENSFQLDVDKLSQSQISELIEICDKRIDEYYEEKGGKREAWYRLKGGRYVPSNIRQDVLYRAMGRCEVCGISIKEKPLHVDHIKPRSKGGESKIENYGALCYTCNSQKMNKYDIDYRKWQAMYELREKGCVFCERQHEIISEKDGAVAVFDKFPVVKDHALIIPSRHVSSFFDLSSYERNVCFLLLEEVKSKLMKKDRSIAAFNVGINVGIDAGQTINHCHIHLMPRRKGDVDNPRGGVRNTIPGKGDYVQNSKS